MSHIHTIIFNDHLQVLSKLYQDYYFDQKSIKKIKRLILKNTVHGTIYSIEISKCDTSNYKISISIMSNSNNLFTSVLGYYEDNNILEGSSIRNHMYKVLHKRYCS